MDAAGGFNASMKGLKGAHGFIAVVNNVNGYELTANSITDVQSVGAISYADLDVYSTGMSDNEEVILISVYFRDTDKPVLTISPVSS